MNVYFAYFKGMWPVGAVAVAVAEDEIMAATQFTDVLKQEINPESCQLICKAEQGEEPKVTVLLDGNY